MQPRIETIPPKKLVGIAARMSRADDDTPALWQALMPRRAEIEQRANDSFLSMRVYDGRGMSIEEMFAPATVHEKWAAVEVLDFEETPAGMQRYDLEGGLYAVFADVTPGAFLETMRHIFERWLPSSSYELDDRPHFEVIPPGWRASDPNATEEIWIPIRSRETVPT